MQGVSVVSAKMSELSAEGKRQYKMLALQLKIQTQMTELGGRTYDVLNKKKSPETDRKIKKLEEQLRKLDAVKKTKTAAPQKPAKKTGKRTSAKKANIQSK